MLFPLRAELDQTRGRRQTTPVCWRNPRNFGAELNNRLIFTGARINMIKRPLIIGAALVATAALMAAEASAQDPSTRFGQWKMDSDAPPPAINIMTYAPMGDGGMSITVAATNSQGQDSEWGYDTMFDGEFRSVWGQDNAETAVEWVNASTTRISNSRNGCVTQVIINVLSEDGNTIENDYIRMDENGKITGVGHATYRRIQ